MQIGMGQLTNLITRGTHPTRITVMAMRTVQVLRIGNRQRQCTDTLISDKELCMAYPAAFHATDELLLHLLLSDHIFELHFVDYTILLRQTVTQQLQD